MCCLTNNVYECTSANAACAAGGTMHLIFKIIANSNAFSFSSTNDDPSSI